MGVVKSTELKELLQQLDELLTDVKCLDQCLAHYQFSCSVVPDSLWPHEPQHTRPPCPSPTHRVYPNSCPLSLWCHLSISSSVNPFSFSSCLQSFPTSGSFQKSRLFTSGSQNIGVSASTSVNPGLISFRMDWLDLLAVQGTLKSSKASNSSVLSFHYSPTLISIHDYWKKP